MNLLAVDKVDHLHLSFVRCGHDIDDACEDESLHPMKILVDRSFREHVFGLYCH